jgi:hypothetical protein
MISAENQQERFIANGWVVGFVDGEGCFSVGFIAQPNRGTRKGYRLGIQVWCEFAVTQGERSLSSLELLKDFFGVGAIYVNRRYDNHKEHLYRYTVRKREELRNVIIPFFQKYPLRTAKRNDFDAFVECFELIEQKQHLTVTGLYRIARIVSKMNRQKDRLVSVMKILNDHTRGIQETGKDMV